MAHIEQIDPEIRENLDALESYLISYEAVLAQGRDDTAQVQYIFRYAHNLKSSFAMIGLTQASGLLHQVESCFDLVRSARRKASEALANAAIGMIDLLRNHIADVEAPFPDSSRLQAIVSEFLGGQDDVEDMRIELPFPLELSQAIDLVQAERSGRQLWIVEKLITSSLPREYFENLPSFEEAQKAGAIVAYFPAWEHLPKSRHECVLQILFATDETAENLAAIVHDPIRAIKPQSIDKCYIDNDIGPASRLVLQELGYHPVASPPASGKVICCSADSGSTSFSSWKRPGLAILALGKYATSEQDVWKSLDAGADTVCPGTGEILKQTQWLEALLNTALAFEPTASGVRNAT